MARPRQRPNKVDYTPFQVYLVAQGFHLAGKRCALQNEVENGKWIHPVIPEAVNYCFAVELFMKCMLKLRGTPKERTHDLKKLFDELPATDHVEMAKVYLTICPGEVTIEEELDSIRDHFVDTRYYFENDLRIINTPTAKACSDAFYQYCAELLQQEMIEDAFPSLHYIPDEGESHPPHSTEQDT